jgi:hypothetical protein
MRGAFIRRPACVAVHERAVFDPREVWQACTSVAQAARRIAPGERRGVLWSAVLLLAAADVTVIAKVLERSAVAGAALGVTTYLEGPRAPFSFV